MPAAEIEGDCELAAPAKVPGPCRVTEGGELGKAAAAPPWCDRRELVAQVLRERHARARVGVACTPARASRTRRCRPLRRRGGTARTAPAGCARRTCPPHAPRRVVRRAPPARRR